MLGGNIGNLLSSLEKGKEMLNTLVINPKEFVAFKAFNVDLDYATKSK